MRSCANGEHSSVRQQARRPDLNRGALNQIDRDRAGADPGRACVPEKGSSNVSVFRATNYASGQVDPTNPNRVTVAFGSYINKFSNESNGCAPSALRP